MRWPTLSWSSPTIPADARIIWTSGPFRLRPGGTAAGRICFINPISFLHGDSPGRKLSLRLSRLGERVATFYELRGNFSR
jgi:hypothetical protein